MIKNILFDLGGVIITLNQSQAVSRFAALGVHDAGQRLDPYTQTGFFGKLEKGEITAEDFRHELVLMVGHDVSHEECAYAWQGYIHELPVRNLQKLRELRTRGFRLILVSNTNPFMMEWAESPDFDGFGHPLSDYFDASYKSYQIGCMKPDLNYFLHVLRHEDMLPEECLFVDDGPRNVSAAGELGMYTFCPKNGDDWTAEIDKMLPK